MSSDVAIRVADLGKCYQIYGRPQDRLKQSILPRVKRLIGRQPTNYYHEFWALKEVSFEIEKGEAVGIIGRNGSGKSTLLQLIAGVLTPTCGQVQNTGRVAALLELGSGFNPEFSGRENVYLNAAIHGLAKEDVDIRFNEIAAFAGIGEFIEQPVKTYSSGMIVRLAFAVSVHVDANVLIVDEALAVGDMGFQYRCLDRLDKLTRSGTTLLFVSHDIGAVNAFCQRAVYMESGRVKMIGTPDHVTDAYLADIRQEDRARHGALLPVTPVGNARQAIGSHDAQIASAAFKSGGVQQTVDIGESIRFEVTVDLTSAIRHPALVVILTDRKLVAIGGKRVPLIRTEASERERVTVDVSMAAKLCPGHYFITLKIEDVQTVQLFRVVEWQSGALQVEVADKHSERHYGVVDIGLRIEQRRSEAVHKTADVAE